MPKIYQYEIYIWKKIPTNSTYVDYTIYPISSLTLVMGGAILTAKQLTETIITAYPPSTHVMFARRVGSAAASIGYKFYGCDSSTAYKIYFELILYKDKEKMEKEVVVGAVSKPSTSHKTGQGFGSQKFYMVDGVSSAQKFKAPKPKSTHDYSYSPNSYYPIHFSSYNLEGDYLICTLGCPSFPARSQKIKGMRYLGGLVKRNTRTSDIYNSLVASKYTSTSKMVDGEDGEDGKDGEAIGSIEAIEHSHNGGGSQRITTSTLISQMQGRFVRPAPASPLHGFVDSRVVSSKEEGETILNEIIETGEIPELIIMDKVSCLYSAVVAPDRIAFGKGNDGATQGDDAVALCLNLGPENEESLRGRFWSDKQWPYAELLYDGKDSSPLIVQMRAGPKMKVENKTIKVSSVTNVEDFKKTTTPAMELIDWKKVVEGLLKEKKAIEQDIEGIEITPVVYHEGGELSSHFGVHCNEKGIPYFTSSPSPKPMEVLEVGKKNKPNLEALREGLAIGLDADIWGSQPPSLASSIVVKKIPSIMSDVKNFLAALHIYPYCDLGDPFTAKFIGFSWAIGVRLIAGLPLGEARHREGAAKEINDVLIKKAIIKTPTLAEGKVEKLVTQNGRDLVYAKAWRLDLETLTTCLIVAKDSFLKESFHWGTSYGGKKWAKCTVSLLRVFVDIKNFLNLPTTLNLGNLVDNINGMINEVHNGGGFSWIDKLSSKQVFDDVGVVPHFFLSPARAYEAKKTILKKFDSKMKSQEKFLALKGVRKEVLGLEELEGEVEKVGKVGKVGKVDEKMKVFHTVITPTSDSIPMPPLPKKPTPKLLVDIGPTYSLEEVQEEMKKKLLLLPPPLLIVGRFKLKGSHLHIQILTSPINRDYGLATEMVGIGQYSEVIAQIGDVEGKKVTSLASNSLYSMVTIRVYEGDLTIVEFSDPKGLLLQVETEGEFSENIEKIK